MNHIKKTALGAGVAATLLLVTVGIAAASQTESTSCSEDGHILNAQAIYSVTTTTRTWERGRYKISGDGTGTHNNIILRIRENGNDVWGWDSPDSVLYGVWDGHSLDNTPTDRSADEQMLFRAIFDEPGADDACNAYVNF